MLLACVQTDVAFANPQANEKTMMDRLSEASERGADLVVFPECMLTGYGYESREEAMEQAIGLEDDQFARFADVASRHRLQFTFGFLLREGEKLFNASALVTPNGVAASYRKVHLPHLGVDRWVDPGDRPFQVDSVALGEDATHGEEEIRVGMAICYDCSFPETIRVLGLAGADVIALGTNWPSTATRTAHLVPAARSMENHLYFVAANRVGTERGFTYCGLSSICGPDGVELARANGDEETILYAKADLELARNKRIERTVGTHVIDRFADRRPEFYSSISDGSLPH